MPRPRNIDPLPSAQSAMELFWEQGFHATSIDDLVTHTGASRHSLYRDFGSKDGLYLTAFDIYRERVTSPALASVETPGADLAAIFAYLEFRVASAERHGLPGRGCFVANAMTETAPASPEVAAKVAAHLDRLQTAFAAAIANTAPYLADDETGALADTLVTFAMGVESRTRVATSSEPLRQQLAVFRRLIEWRI